MKNVGMYSIAYVKQTNTCNIDRNFIMFYISKWTFQISEETRDNKIQRIECMTLGFLCWLFDILV